MSGTLKLKFISILFIAAVVSIVLYNFLLYHKNYYGSASFLVASRTVLSKESSVNQLIAKLDMTFEHENINSKDDKHVANSTTSQEKAGSDSASLRYHNHTINFTNFTYHNHKPVHDGNNLKNTSHPAASSQKTGETSGYILALKIYEQQTMATGNLLQLQCFASKLNLSVVQPSMQGSCLSTPLDSLQHSHMLQLEDVYNMQEWRAHTRSKGYASLVRWEEFIEHAPRDVILIQMKYPILSQIKDIRDSGKQFPHPVSESKNYEKGCGYKIVNIAFGILKKKGFRLIHNVCFNFLSGDEIPFEVYRRDLLGGRDPTTVTVVIDEWRGFGENQRVLIEEKICPKSNYYREYVNSSLRVVSDAQRYMDKYLPHANTTGYLAVIGRYEMAALTRNMHDKSDPRAIISFCLQETMKEMLNMRGEMGEEADTFLSMDIGKYGSGSFVKHGYYGHQRDMENFVGSVYGNDMNITDWERTFESVVETTDSGYIAKVQQAIVVRAKCILFVGGGTFQRHTLHLYQQLHPNPSDRCVRILEKCTSPYRPVE